MEWNVLSYKWYISETLQEG